jgi:hypothetical protein
MLLKHHLNNIIRAVVVVLYLRFKIDEIDNADVRG